MKENSIEKDIELLQNATNSLGLFLKCKGSEKYKTAIDHILSDYKRVSEENKKHEKLIEKMKQFLLKENKMCDFLESEEK